MSGKTHKELSLTLIHQGKVRDIYAIDNDYMLIVASDRLSAFDVIFDQPDTLHEREAIAKVCALRLNLAMPMLLDDMDNQVDTLFAALPERLYLLDDTGRVVYRTVVGSPGFDLDAWEGAIAQYCAVPAALAGA